MIQTSQDFPHRFEAQLRDRSFFKPGDRILVACSGGPDSVALVHLMARLALGNRWRIGILHYDHRLRPASRTDAKFVRGLAHKLGLDYYGGSGDVKCEARATKTSIEEAARKMRYDFFLKTAKHLGIKKVVLAHTLGDQAETVLMRLLQGTGLRGLQGIRETHSLRGVSFIRPLLAFTKKDLLLFLRAAKVTFRKDRSNDSTQYLRNRIRLQLIPSLQRDFNPRVAEALARIPAIVTEESELIEELEEKAWKKTFKKIRTGELELRRTPFLKCHPALQFRLVERALKKLDRQSGLSFEAWDRLRRGLRQSRFRCSLPRDIDFDLSSKKILLFKKFLAV